MYKMHGRLKPASKEETAGLKNRYFKCEKCKKVILFTKVEFAMGMVCDDCGGNLHEVNPYESKSNVDY